MNNKKLAILGIAAVLFAVAAVWVNRMEQSAQTSNLTNSPLIGGLDIEAVASIQVVGEKGADKVTLKRSEGRFVVIEKENYPASNAKVNELINACVDMRTAELQSDDPAFHEDLGVTDQKAKFKITFADSQDKPIVSLLISNPPAEGKQEVFARLESDDKTYLVLESPYIQTKPLDYVDGQLMQTEAAKISEVALTDPNGTSYTLKAGEGDTVVLSDMPAGKQFKGTDYRQVFGAISGLRFDDVAAMSDVYKDLKFGSKYVCTLKDSTVYTLELAKKDGKNFMKMTAEFTDKTPVTIEKGGSESEEVLKAKETKLLASDAAGAFAKKHAGWLYILPDSKFTELTKAKGALLEDIPAKPADPNQPAAKPV